MRPILRVATAVGAGVFLVSAVALQRLEAEGPPQATLELEGGTPATFFLPPIAGGPSGRDVFREARPPEARAPGVVLMHGFSTDRLGLGTLARHLASAGFAVLTFDARGHGENRQPYPRGRGRPDPHRREIAAAVDFLRDSPLVDGERIAVMGHSMGASASLDFATRDAGLDATVLIAGGAAMLGPLRPANALFLYAAGDPARIQQRSQTLAGRLAGVDPVELGRTYGDPTRGDAVRVVEVAGVDHATIVFSAAAAGEIIRWLDAAFGLPPRETSSVGDPRLTPLLVNALALLLVLPGIGLVVGRLVPALEPRPASGGWAALAGLAVALLVAMPFGVAGLLAWLPLEVGADVVALFLVAGVIVTTVRTLRGTALSTSGWREPRVLAGVGVAVLAIHAAFLPLGAVVHRLSLTPERFGAFVVTTLALLPISLAFQTAVRRGGPIHSLVLGVAGRMLVLGTLALGVWLGLLAPVMLLMLPALVLVFVGMELFAVALYAEARNPLAIAGVDAAWLAMVIAAVMPIRL